MMTDINKQSTPTYMATKNLYDGGTLIFKKDCTYQALTEDKSIVIGENNAFYHIPFVEIKDKEDKYDKDNFGGLFLIEITWATYPPEGGCAKYNKEQIIQAFDSGHELADYLNNYKTKLLKDPSNVRPEIVKIERI